MKTKHQKPSYHGYKGGKGGAKMPKYGSGRASSPGKAKRPGNYGGYKTPNDSGKGR